MNAVTDPALAEPTPESTPDAIAAPLEALLLMATEPLSAAELAQALDVPKPVVWAALESLARFYDDTGRGFELREVGQGWRYYTRAEHAEVIGRWVLEGQHARLSQAALETLAVVAYLQPVSRSRVSAIRGVSVDGVMRTLATRGLIEEAGHSEETGALLFATTDHFLERMGYTSLDDLAPLAPHLPEASQLEAELARLADQVAPAASGGEDGPMTESSELPTAADVGRWAHEEATVGRETDDHERDEAPDQAVLDRLSDDA